MSDPATSAPQEQTPAPKKGIRTTEFWLVVATFVDAALQQSGVFPENGRAYHLLALGAMALTSAGYSVARAWVKKQ